MSEYDEHCACGHKLINGHHVCPVTNAAIEKLLSASQAREAELREKLEAIEENAQIEIDRLNAQILDRDTKLEAAEASAMAR